MNKDDKSEVSNPERCSFGVMGEILRTLQREEEELEVQSRTGLKEVTALNTIQDQMETLKEINTTLKEILEIQKAILDEIIKNRIE